MAPPTRAATKIKALTKGVGKNDALKAAKTKRDQVERKLKIAQEKWQKGDQSIKEEVENQTNLLAQMQENVVRMEEDTELGAGELDEGESEEADSEEANSKEADSEEANSKEASSKEANSRIDTPKTANIENEEGSLFVQDKTRTQGGDIASTPESASESDSNKPLASMDDNFDDIGLVHAFGDMSLNKESGELEKYFKGSFGKYYGVYRHGPDSSARHTIDYIANNYNNLPENLKSDKSLDMEHSSMISEGRQVFRVLAVAWTHAGQHGRMSSLAPSNWKMEKNSTRRHAPTIVVKVRWDSDNGPVSWEKRGLAKGRMYAKDRDPFAVPETIKYDAMTILEQGAHMDRADHLIIHTAVRLEMRHGEYVRGDRKGEGRDPTPGLPLLSETKAAKRSGGKDVAKI